MVCARWCGINKTGQLIRERLSELESRTGRAAIPQHGRWSLFRKIRNVHISVKMNIICICSPPLSGITEETITG